MKVYDVYFKYRKNKEEHIEGLCVVVDSEEAAAAAAEFYCRMIHDRKAIEIKVKEHK